MEEMVPDDFTFDGATEWQHNKLHTLRFDSLAYASLVRFRELRAVDSTDSVTGLIARRLLLLPTELSDEDMTYWLRNMQDMGGTTRELCLLLAGRRHVRM